MRFSMYVLLFGAVLTMLATCGIGLGWIPVGHRVADHWTTAIWAVLLVLLSHTVILFYFLATGKQLRVLMEKSGRPVNTDFLTEIRLFKAKVMPWVMASIFITITAFILGGAYYWGALPRAFHTVSGLLALGANLGGMLIEVRCIERNSRLIRAIDGEYLPRVSPASKASS